MTAATVTKIRKQLQTLAGHAPDHSALHFYVWNVPVGPKRGLKFQLNVAHEPAQLRVYGCDRSGPHYYPTLKLNNLTDQERETIRVLVSERVTELTMLCASVDTLVKTAAEELFR